MKSFTYFLLGAGVVFVFGSGFTSVRGQSGTTQGTRGRTDPVQRELQRRFELEAIEGALARIPRRHSEHERRLLLAQIRKDFLRLQIINDELQKSASRAGPLDLKVVASCASEITKLAARLKDNLALPEGETTSDPPRPKVETGIQQQLSLLSVLNNSIQRFVGNPVFERSRLVDAKLSAQAGRDLEQIIEVSKQVKGNSEKLKRAMPKAAKT